MSNNTNKFIDCNHYSPQHPVSYQSDNSFNYVSLVIWVMFFSLVGVIVTWAVLAF